MWQSVWRHISSCDLESENPGFRVAGIEYHRLKTENMTSSQLGLKEQYGPHFTSTIDTTISDSAWREFLINADWPVSPEPTWVDQ